ncbi:single-stranded-DNA-specific exonuclease RecJ [Oscillatoria sp. FACHB-1406]|uniref:single-stranded-DNA-specific exonuclease RecJ n=1 Tax=Oscillatoria sp. FACHB-1406 TaxID=2692846 RepID=UPI001684B501|nr:single-stranded-DNA-specific exonuclease RecJ [Oscillatoria sp. FACHB-1406]MBD2577528.1 single-stranded-DNA-specific exonuclease RecJ [Oscillatoria sp. FACHB-1406]
MLPDRRWKIADPDTEKVNALVEATGLFPLVAKVLVNRGINTPELAQVFIEPESEILPDPAEEFADLTKSVELLKDAIAQGEKIAICGDYDVDGMTSTALLLRALRHLGADVDYAIPSRMKDGYGINKRMVKELAKEGVGLILTVDNGIRAVEPIQLAVELGITVIITDHHELPEELPPADAILNPKTISSSSPYRGLAGVGVAYILAVATAQSLAGTTGLTSMLLDFFTLGTVADLAPLVGVNRRWLKRGLKRLHQSRVPGIQALIGVAGQEDSKKELKPDDIGFKLGPRINAIGRIGEPKLIIDLFTAEDLESAKPLAQECNQCNTTRQDLCKQIEFEAIALIEGEPGIDWRGQRVLVVFKEDWHHGVIGIVASRLVERYGVPTFICTYDDEGEGKIRGSARSIPEFHIAEALNYCDDLLGKHGGHQAAGGFSLEAKNFSAFEARLSEFAHQYLEPEHLKPLVTVDAEVDFDRITPQLYAQIDCLNPWGIGNPEPIFWTPNVRVLEQQVVKDAHLKFKFGQEIEGKVAVKSAIAWRWRTYFPFPARVDIAYKLKENEYKGERNIELELVGVRASSVASGTIAQRARFEHNGRSYLCNLLDGGEELRIKNPQGKVLSVRRGQRTGLLGMSREDAEEVMVTQAPYYEIVKAAKDAIAALEKSREVS